MKIFVTSRFKDAVHSKDEIEKLCLAVRNGGHEDFSFIRDVEHYEQKHFSSQQQVWREALKHLRTCDALLINVSDKPSGGRNVEVGMAYAIGIPIFVAVREGVDYKDFYNGISEKIIKYSNFGDITKSITLV